MFFVFVERPTHEAKFGFIFQTQGLSWFKNRVLIKAFIAEHRLGKHGLRPFGSTRATARKPVTLGARIPSQGKFEATSKQPLGEALGKVKIWFENERTHGIEVRSKHIIQRTRTTIEYERDKQLVLQELANPQFQEAVLAACQEKLEILQVHHMCKKGWDWLDRVVLTKIGATERAGQNKSHKPVRLDRVKFSTTAEGVDYAIYLVSEGSEEELQDFVADVEAFATSRQLTVVIVIDESALWLKLRGEEKVF